MLEIDLKPYDFIIATPPCNYYSRANWKRNKSEYSLKTKHLLPKILMKLNKLNKPYLVENVRNKTLMKDIYNLVPFVYEYGRHTYFTNILFNPNNIPQKYDDIQNGSKALRQGGENVHNVIEYWLENVYEIYEKKERKGD